MKRVEGMSDFPRGWFLIAFSDELAPGAVTPLEYFGKHLVLFRTADGAAVVLDAHCPHMGAHLGWGGRVDGEGIVCPFHAWRFDAEGGCDDIPYAKRIPPKAKVDCWPTRERAGMIFVWHDPFGGAPGWEIPALDTDGWTPWNHASLEVATHPREIVENVVDVGHFIPVHGTHVEEISNEFEGHTAVQINSGVAYPLGGGSDRYSLRATYYGPAYQVTSMSGHLEARLINAHVPIAGRRLLLRFAVSARPRPGQTIDQAFLDRYIENLRQGFLQDVRIWEHMTPKDPPVLCDGDGPIIPLRRWYRQFYLPAEGA